MSFYGETLAILVTKYCKCIQVIGDRQLNSLHWLSWHTIYSTVLLT